MVLNLSNLCKSKYKHHIACSTFEASCNLYLALLLLSSDPDENMDNILRQLTVLPEDMFCTDMVMNKSTQHRQGAEK